MRFLLDTHSFLWFIAGNERLSQVARELIEDEDNTRLLSTASLWEIAILLRLGKITLNQPFDVYVSQKMRLNRIETMNIQINHLSLVSSLPFHHRDPFDRLMAAQCLVEGLPILSVDSIFDDYGVQRLW